MKRRTVIAYSSTDRLVGLYSPMMKTLTLQWEHRVLRRWVVYPGHQFSFPKAFAYDAARCAYDAARWLATCYVNI